MFLAAFLIGLREGLEAALVIGILLAYVTKLGRPDVRRKVWLGALIAAGLSLAFGAIFTFGRAQLSFFAQEVIGGSMSLVAVAMVTWMVFWMLKTAPKLRGELHSGVDKALAIGTGWAIFWLAFVTVAREGVETTLLLWGWVGELLAFVAALAGIALAVTLGALFNRGILRINLRVFFIWSGAFLILVSAGVLAYGIHDLQEAAVLPGPFSGHPITPTDFRTGEVLTGLDGPFWLAAFPFGWAFNVEDVIAPTGLLATLLKGTIGFAPQMSWLEVTAWAVYLATVVPLFIRAARRSRPGKVGGKTAGKTTGEAGGKPSDKPASTAAATTTIASTGPRIDTSSTTSSIVTDVLEQQLSNSR